MASFVEQATLRIDDQSTNQIKSINRELKSLFKTANKMRSMKFDVGGIKHAQGQIKSLTASLKKLPRQKTINLNVNQKGTVPKQPRVPTPAVAGGGRGGSLVTSQTLRFAKAVIYSYGAIKVGSAALSALNDAQAQDTRERSIFRNDPASIAAIDAAGKNAALNTPRIDYTRGREISTDLLLGGIKPNMLPQFSTLFANTESSVGALFPGLEKSVTLFNNKLLNLANSSDDLTRSMALTTGAAKGIAAAGESFNAVTTLRAIQQANLAPTINPEGLARFILITDAMGQSAGTSTNRLRKELFTPDNQAGAGSGIAKGAVANLNKRGLRGYTASEQAMFGQDPIKFIQDVLGPRIAKQGVDLNDRSALDKYLQQAGFNNTSQRVITQALTSIDELNQQLKVVSGIDPQNPNAGAEGNLKLASDNLIKSFNTLSSQVLVPLAEQAAPLVNGLADYVEKVSLTGSTMDKLNIAASAAAGTFLAYKAGTSILSQLLSPLNGSATALTGSAGALTRAAIALGGSGVAGGGAAAGVAGAGAAAGGSLVSSAMSLLGKAIKIGGVTYLAYNLLDDAPPGPSPEQLKNANKNAWWRSPEKQGPPIPSGMVTPDRTAALDAFLNGPTQFQQAFATGSQQAGTTLETSLTTGAAGVAQALSTAIINAGQSAAAAMGAAISSAQISVPTQVTRPNTGALNPTE